MIKHFGSCAVYIFLCADSMKMYVTIQPTLDAVAQTPMQCVKMSRCYKANNVAIQIRRGLHNVSICKSKMYSGLCLFVTLY